MWRTAAKRFVRHVCFRNPCPLFLFTKTFNPLGNQRVGKVENWVGSHNPAQTSSGSMFELWVSDVFEWSFAVKFLYPKFAVLPRSKHLMPVTVKLRLDFWVCGLHGHLLWHQAMSAPCFHVTKSHEAMKDCRDWVFSHDGFEVGRPACQLFMFAKCYALPQRIEKIFLRDVCLRTMLFRNSKPTLPARSLRSLRAAAHFASSALWLHHACKR